MQGAMPISMATVGTAYTIKKISGNTEVRSHLKSMGFNEGTEVKLITHLNLCPLPYHIHILSYSRNQNSRNVLLSSSF